MPKVKLHQRRATVRARSIKNEAAEVQSITTDSTNEDIDAFFGITGSLEGREALNAATYYACMQIRCNAFAKLPIKIKRFEGRGSITIRDSDLNVLLQTRPNRFTSAHDFKFATEFQRIEYGDAFWYMDYDLRGRLQGLYLLDSRRMKIYIDDVGLIDIGKKNAVYYVYSDSRNGQMIFTEDEICHFKNFSKNGIVGTPIKKYLFDCIDSELYANKMLKEKYQSGLQDPIIVQYIGELSPDKENKIKKKFASLGGAKNTFREAFFDMTKFVNVETVTTKSGARTYQQKATVTGFQLVAESGATPALAQPQFLRRTYTIKDYAGFIPVSRQLLSDTDANLVRVIMRWFGRNSAATRNNLIFNLIKTKTQTTIANMNDLRTALNVTLGSVYKPTSKIFVNDDALNYIDGLVDGDGRPFLNPDPTAPAQMRFRVGANVIPIVNVPNAFLPTVSNVAPIIIGDLEEGITLFDREHLTIDRSEVASVGSYNAFAQGGTLFRGIEREDVVQVDGDAFVYGGIDLTQATANGSGYSPFLGVSSEEEGGNG